VPTRKPRRNPSENPTSMVNICFGKTRVCQSVTVAWAVSGTPAASIATLKCASQRADSSGLISRCRWRHCIPVSRTPSRLTAEYRLKELLQALPLAGSVAPKETSEIPISLQAVIEPIDDHADPGAAPKGDEDFGVRGDRRAPTGPAHRAR
jgi:hypothetical protein